MSDDLCADVEIAFFFFSSTRNGLRESLAIQIPSRCLPPPYIRAPYLILIAPQRPISRRSRERRNLVEMSEGRDVRGTPGNPSRRHPEVPPARTLRRAANLAQMRAAAHHGGACVEK